MSLTKVSYSMINGATVNVFDYMTAADQEQVVARNQTAGAPDVTYALQGAIDATPKGGQLRIPNGLYRHTGLTVVQGIEIVGDTPPDLWDNDSTIVLNGGTVLWNSNIAGNNLTVEPPNLGDRRLRFHIQDVLLLGALWTGSAFVTSGSGYSGHGLYVNGRSGAGIETAVELSWERLSCSFNADHGIFLTGSIYNGECGHAWLYKNGKNNFRIEATGEPIGEMTFRQLSCFIGGSKTGATGYDTANVYIASGGCINIGLLSSTGSVGTPVVLAGGRYNIGIIWSEGGGGTSNANSIVVEFGNGNTNPSGAEISFIVANPGDNYLGKIVLFRTNSRGCHIGQVLVDAAGLTNTLVEFQTDADGHTVKRLSGTTTGTEIVDAGNNNTYANLFSVRSAYTKRGLWTPTNLAVGKENSGDVTSGSVGHGLFSDGTANLSASSSDAGGIAYLACNNNAAVADGYKFFSFRIGTTPSEIGKIAVASSGTAINYATSSDYRLKENPQPMTDALNRICQLKPVTFTWKSKQILGEGFLAHELQQVFPAAVTGEKDQVGIDNEPLYQGVDASKIVAALVSAVQELTERIKVLEGK